MHTPARRIDALVDELIEGPVTPRRPVSSAPPAFPGDVSRSYEEVTAPRGRSGAHHLSVDEIYSGALREADDLLRKTDDDSSKLWIRACNDRARQLYAMFVAESGGGRQVARNESCDESMVRRRMRDAGLWVNLAQVLAGGSPRGLAALGKALIQIAREREAEVRRGA